jgi:DNA-binding transcriptional MerR regulator
MESDSDKNKKLYYSIKEVADMVGVNESTLRYWEKEFPNVRPKTAGTNKVRQYTERNIEDLKIIYNLIKVRGLKISAARIYLRNNREGVDKSSEIISLLQDTLTELKSIKKHLDLL